MNKIKFIKNKLNYYKMREEILMKNVMFKDLKQNKSNKTILKLKHLEKPKYKNLKLNLN